MQYYFAKEKKDNLFILNDDDMYHIKTVMRMNNKDNIVVTYHEKSYLCELDNNKIVIKNELEQVCDNIPYVRIIIPLLKEQKMDYILQKATELGVAEIVLYESKRSIIKINGKEEKKKNRWIKIMKEASEQCHRNTIPKLTGILKLDELKNIDGLKLIASTREKSKNVKKILKIYADCDKMNVVIGPEGGLDEQEEATLIEMDYIPTSFGNRIMRVETVPLFFLSIINYENME